MSYDLVIQDLAMELAAEMGEDSWVLLDRERRDWYHKLAQAVDRKIDALGVVVGL